MSGIYHKNPTRFSRLSNSARDDPGRSQKDLDKPCEIFVITPTVLQTPIPS